MMGPLANRLGLLKEKLENLKKSGASKEKAASLTNKLGEIQGPIQKIVTNMKMLGRIVTNDKYEILRVDEIVNETINLLKDIADREHIILSFTPPEKLLVVRSQPAALQQILLNLLLNAIQQIAEFRSHYGGIVHVSVRPVATSTEEKLLRISIEDNGPGIHTSLWETVFELGYSTRQDGSGIGLYISRSLAEEKLDGSLFIQESYILGGTTMALEIPHRI
jgi:signal transduction histidine kinase